MEILLYLTLEPKIVYIQTGLRFIKKIRRAPIPSVILVNGRVSAAQFFYFETEKFPPVISDLFFADSVQFEEVFIFSVLAVDSNGAEDISRVYYELYRPDGSQVANSQGITKFPMFDDGNSQAGDETAGDSIYTQKLYFPSNLPSFPSGSYRFEITAEDRTKRLSNTIVHYLEVY